MRYNKLGSTGLFISELCLGTMTQVTSVVVVARRIELHNNIGAVHLALSEDVLQAFDAASALPADYPGWMLSLWSGARAQQLTTVRTTLA